MDLGATVTTMSDVARTFAVIALDVADPGFGLVTVIAMFPTCAAVAVPVAVNSVGEMNVVVSCCVPKFTTERIHKTRNPPA